MNSLLINFIQCMGEASKKYDSGLARAILHDTVWLYFLANMPAKDDPDFHNKREEMFVIAHTALEDGLASVPGPDPVPHG